MKKYAMVGAGSRGFAMFASRIYEDFGDYAKLCGLYDINATRAIYTSKKCGDVPVYDSFERMLKEAKPDCVIVTTIDAMHHEYAVKAMEAGCDVIIEKPMTIDAKKCGEILAAEKRTGRKVIVTFNCRYMPIFSKIKEIISQMVIGEVLSVDLEWQLDNRHGADYFRRWHRNINKSGGLLVHKATHHFDVVNWCIDDRPSEVSAFGSRRFYGPTRKNRGTRCHDCKYKDTCEFYFDITADNFIEDMYFEAEKDDGYIRDGCVFADEINIYDTMAVNVKYKKGTSLAYSLIAYSPYEGWKMSITGSKGRLEAEGYNSGSKTNELFKKITVYDFNGDITDYNIKPKSGAHGGGDELLRRMLFVGDVEDVLNRMADSYDGAYSLLIGASANKSIAEKRIVSIDEIIESFEGINETTDT